jgi:hypothetical protein
MKINRRLTGLLLLSLVVVSALSAADRPEPVEIGDRRELFVDSFLIDRLEGVQLKLHPPLKTETVLECNEPWESPSVAYVTVIADDDRFRMYYRGSTGEEKATQVTCYAESEDGITWTKPNLGLFEANGSTENNIVWKQRPATHNFTPFKDTRPDIPAGERYKAIAYGRGGPGLGVFVSADGIHWEPLHDGRPVITQGKFDSQNLAFWDPNKQKYVAYYRILHQGVRAVALAESDDFLNWSEPKPIVVADPPEQFYTNATAPYFRAPHYYFAFPKRFQPRRQRLEDHPSRGISDAVFLSSRDGLHFDRTFREALIRPGREARNWGDRGTMPAWGLVQTSPDEMSLYITQHYRYETAHLKRCVFRLDGIASAHAGYDEGELVTRPLRFEGSRLVLNYSTSAAGSVRIELQQPDGTPIPGFTLADAPELFGDEIEEAYRWKKGPDVSSLSGQPVRLRFVLQDADLYSFRFDSDDQ